MPTPSVQLDVYNMALGHIGVAPLSNLAGTDNITVCLNLYWNAAVRETQRGAPWDFNTVLVTLAQNSTYNILNDWAYAYTYPAVSQAQTECLKIWKIFSPIAGPAATVGVFPGVYPGTSVDTSGYWNMRASRYKVVYDPVSQTKVILSNISSAIAEYSTPVFDTTLWDSAFVKALALNLAAMVCTPIVNDDNKTKNLAQLAEAYMSEAQRMNDEEGDGDHNNETSAFLEARGGFGTDPRFWPGQSTSSY